jgi:hypothetical protein
MIEKLNNMNKMHSNIYRKNLIKNIIKFLRTDIISTIRINAKLPFRQFLKFPVWIYGGTIDSLKGYVKIDNSQVSPGMIRLGLKTSGMCGKRNGINLDISGE